MSCRFIFTSAIFDISAEFRRRAGRCYRADYDYAARLATACRHAEFILGHEGRGIVDAG